MFANYSSRALLVNLGGAHLPPLALSVSSRYQACVDAGVSAAAGFFDDLAAVGLHDHIACSVSVFTEAVCAGLAKSGDTSQNERKPALMPLLLDTLVGYIKS